MDHRSATMMQPGRGGAGAATQEYLYVGGGGQPAAQQAVDGVFLMKLLEDAPAADQQPEDVDRLSHVIRSLEAEIGGAPSAPADGRSTADEYAPSDVDGGLEDMLLDLDSCPGACAAEALPFEYWAEVAPAVGHDMGGWYVAGDGAVVGEYELREHCYYGYGEGPAVELVYSPLWE